MRIVYERHGTDPFIALCNMLVDKLIASIVLYLQPVLNHKSYDGAYLPVAVRHPCPRPFPREVQCGVTLLLHSDKGCDMGCDM